MGTPFRFLEVEAGRLRLTGKARVCGLVINISNYKSHDHYSMSAPDEDADLMLWSANAAWDECICDLYLVSAETKSVS